MRLILNCRFQIATFLRLSPRFIPVLGIGVSVISALGVTAAQMAIKRLRSFIGTLGIRLGGSQMLRVRTLTVVGVILLVSAILLTEPAFSQTGATSDAKAGIDFTQIIVAVINLAFPAVVGVAAYLINMHVKNQQMATLLSNAVQNGLGVVQQKTTAALRSADLTVGVGKPDIASGVQYVIDNAAEAISHFNIPKERIAQKIEAKLGLAEIATNLAATASPAPVIAGPLAPAPLGRIEVPT